MINYCEIENQQNSIIYDETRVINEKVFVFYYKFDY